MNKYITMLGACAVVLLCVFSYFLGKSTAKVEIVTKEVEKTVYITEAKDKNTQVVQANKEKTEIKLGNTKNEECAYILNFDVSKCL